MTAARTEGLTPPQIYRLLTGLVVPRPIAWVSSLSRDGVPNLAPFSFFQVLGVEPPTLGISINLREARHRKDTLVNIQDTGEYVINIVSEETAAAMNVSSLDWPHGVDEFVQAGLEPAYDALVVKAPRVASSPAQFECRYVRSIEFGNYTLVVGEAVAVHARDGLCDASWRVDQARLKPVGRLAGFEYCLTRDRFALNRAADSPEQRPDVKKAAS